MQINPAKFHIEFVKHAVIAGAEFEFRAALQPFVREIFQLHSHFINLALHRFADADGKSSNAFENVCDQI